MFKLLGKKIFTILCSMFFFNLTYDIILILVLIKKEGPAKPPHDLLQDLGFHNL